MLTTNEIILIFYLCDDFSKEFTNHIKTYFTSTQR